MEGIQVDFSMEIWKTKFNYGKRKAKALVNISINLESEYHIVPLIIWLGEGEGGAGGVIKSRAIIESG